MSSNAKKYINSTIGLVIMFGFGVLPPFGPITEYGMKMFGIFIGNLSMVISGYGMAIDSCLNSVCNF